MASMVRDTFALCADRRALSHKPAQQARIYCQNARWVLWFLYSKHILQLSLHCVLIICTPFKPGVSSKMESHDSFASMYDPIKFNVTFLNGSQMTVSGGEYRRSIESLARPKYGFNKDPAVCESSCFFNLFARTYSTRSNHPQSNWTSVLA